MIDAARDCGDQLAQCSTTERFREDLFRERRTAGAWLAEHREPLV
jgi:hypothetical protein